MEKIKITMDDNYAIGTQSDNNGKLIKSRGQKWCRDAGMKNQEKRRIDPAAPADEEYATFGPLTRIFDNPTARVLDQSLIVGRMEQTIKMLVESTNLSYKTVAKEVKRLVGLGLMEPSRRVGNAQTFQFNVDNHLSSLIQCAQKMQIEEMRREAAADL